MSEDVPMLRSGSGFLLIAMVLAPVIASSYVHDRSGKDPVSSFIDADLIDHQGKNFSLYDLQGRPFILSFVFTGCSSYCPTQVVHLDQVRDNLAQSVGQDGFAIVSVSLTPAVNSPDDMKRFRDRFSIDAPNWLFATGNDGHVTALIDEVGTKVIPTSDPGDVDHTTHVYVVDSSGQLISKHQGVPLDAPGLKYKIQELAGHPRTP